MFRDDAILIYDIEASNENGVDVKTNKFRCMGAYSYLTKKYYFITDVDEVKKIFKAHDHLSGFNTLQYDNPVMENSGFDDIMQSNQYDTKVKYKNNIDIMQIFKSRAGAMKIKKGMLGDLLMSFSLDYISRTLELVDEETGKGHLDYKLLNKPVNEWTKEEYEEIKKYTMRDIEVTKKLYDWLEEYFCTFKDFLNEGDINRKSCNKSIW